MHILFLTQVLPYPLDTGAKVRAYHVLRHLAQHHEVTLVSFVRSGDRPDYVTHLEGLCRAVHTVPVRRAWWRDGLALVKGLATRQSILIVRDENRAMRATLRRLVRETPFDVVHADQTSMAQYALYARSQVPNSREEQLRLLFDAHNALYRIPKRLAAHEGNPLKRILLRREARALARYEVDLLRRFDRVVFVAEQDRKALIAQSATSNLELETRSTIIPICIDPARKSLVERLPHPETITHLGTMFWPPNVEGVLWFAREVLPRVLEQVPEARFTVVGKDPPQEVRGLTRQVRNVRVTGYVRDPLPYLAETAVFIVPVRAAGGMRVKILDAWCWGMPIVSTTIGAEDIDIRDGENILIADTAADFATAVIRILQEPELGERLRRNGRRWVEDRYNWRRAYARWDEIYEQL